MPALVVKRFLSETPRRREELVIASDPRADLMVSRDGLRPFGARIEDTHAQEVRAHTCDERVSLITQENNTVQLVRRATHLFGTDGSHAHRRGCV